MRKITPELYCNPRRLVVNKANNTWWEIGNDGEDYQTDADPKVYKWILHSYDLHKQSKRRMVVESVTYEYEVIE